MSWWSCRACHKLFGFYTFYILRVKETFRRIEKKGEYIHLSDCFSEIGYTRIGFSLFSFFIWSHLLVVFLVFHYSSSAKGLKGTTHMRKGKNTRKIPIWHPIDFLSFFWAPFFNLTMISPSLSYALCNIISISIFNFHNERAAPYAI